VRLRRFAVEADRLGPFHAGRLQLSQRTDLGLGVQGGQPDRFPGVSGVAISMAGCPRTTVPISSATTSRSTATTSDAKMVEIYWLGSSGRDAVVGRADHGQCLRCQFAGRVCGLQFDDVDPKLPRQSENLGRVVRWSWRRSPKAVCSSSALTMIAFPQRPECSPSWLLRLVSG
jgi:hypothetical protein